VLASTRPSSPASTSTYFSLEPPNPTLTRAPGSVASASRSSRLDGLLGQAGALVRGVRLSVSVALRIPARRRAKGSAPALPPPMAV
jgi:hypothetical protein